MYEEYKAFSEKLTTLRDKFQVELDQAKVMANVCTVIIFIVIVAAGLAIAVVTTLIEMCIRDSIKTIFGGITLDDNNSKDYNS